MYSISAGDETVMAQICCIYFSDESEDSLGFFQKERSGKTDGEDTTNSQTSEPYYAALKWPERKALK
jgi:hypothetical protein